MLTAEETLNNGKGHLGGVEIMNNRNKLLKHEMYRLHFR